ncbi:ATP-binding protein [Methylicorpusculum sp.]|uniref:ATP-binding protein n=1 Tax=Methylicorpusculum sp. TaxID=2713644 RepID=UPI002722DEE4|nr:ATP-binding protein [Methylicorpusculum sp.]MDO8842889.1 ATP-binding protein [Methylicorpusculum sp.]
MKSLQLQLTIGLLLSLIVSFIVLWSMTGSTLQQLAEDYLAGHLAHDGESIMQAVSLTADQQIAVDTTIVEPVYKRPLSGNYYLVTTSAGSIKSDSLAGQGFEVPLLSSGQTLRFFNPGPDGQPLLILAQAFSLKGVRVTVAVAEDFSKALGMIDAVQQGYTKLALALLMALIAIQIIILRAGFKPLKKIQHQLQALEEGELYQLETDVPKEVVGLVNEVNDLLRIMDQRLQRKRNSLGDLAHALKTPLTVLQQLAHEDEITHHTDVQAQLITQTSNMHRIIDRVLKRVRLAGPGSVYTSFDVEQEITDLIHAMKRIHHDKQLLIHAEFNGVKSLMIDREDMLELTGNLMDNACKWCKRQVVIRFHADNQLLIVVEDDGNGAPDSALPALSQRGIRLDERIDGQGLGLSIAQAITDQYDGALTFSRSAELGGFCVQAVLHLRSASI